MTGTVLTYAGDAFTSALRWALLVLAIIAVLLLLADAIRALVVRWRESRSAESTLARRDAQRYSRHS